MTTGEYACPGDEAQTCVRGGVFSAPAQALKVEATTAKAAAEADIKANAEESYGEKIYGGITSHEELRSEAVTVAGQKGYLVRWKVVTKNGDDGYVESLAFPSPNVKSMLVVVRSGFDINAEGSEALGPGRHHPGHQGSGGDRFAAPVPARPPEHFHSHDGGRTGHSGTASVAFPGGPLPPTRTVGVRSGPARAARPASLGLVPFKDTKIDRMFAS